MNPNAKEAVWTDSGNGMGSWTQFVNTELFGRVKVDIPAKNNQQPLTEIQNRSIQMLCDLTPAFGASLTAALRSYAIRYLGDAYNPEDCEYSCANASVPYLHDATSAYLFLNADSDVDDEHGVCFLIREGIAIACIHGDTSLEFLGWDATDELDALANPDG